ncbi:MAG: twin-arginine translocation pathway signal protein [Magnetococcales bacterium]|nr:twin-arginine translocation pathway signal protein [Magnetococcales bacterium]
MHTSRRQLVLGMLVGGAWAGDLMPEALATTCPTNGTPEQFTPKKPKDPNPLEQELEKYPNCPYCGMNRREHHASRHLIHFEDDLVDGVCSLHCAAISLAINLDRGPKAIYVADFGEKQEPRPLVGTGSAVYLLGSTIQTAMTTRGKPGFADRNVAAAMQTEKGGTVVDFEAALVAAYGDMAKDTLAIRKRRLERRKKMNQGGE